MPRVSASAVETAPLAAAQEGQAALALLLLIAAAAAWLGLRAMVRRWRTGQRARH